MRELLPAGTGEGVKEVWDLGNAGLVDRGHLAGRGGRVLPSWGVGWMARV